MNVYFAASIRAGRQLLPTYQAIVRHLQAAGHTVLSEGVALTTMAEQGVSDEAIYEQDTAWLDACDVVVAEVTVPSLGVGYEIGYALHHAHKPVLCLCQQAVQLSAMLTGNTADGLTIAFYENMSAALSEVDRILGAFGN